jgi:hypothetical protein
MSDYFFQQPDEEEKREYLRMEAERIRRQMEINGPQRLPTPPSQNISPRLDGPTPINGLNSPDLGPMPEGSYMEKEILKLLFGDSDLDVQTQ